MPTNGLLIPQDAQMPGDKKGRRGKTRPEELRSGTLYGQYQLRGSILTIKDSSTTASGFMAFGADMTTIPTSATTGTGIYIDYTGIYGLSSGTQQAYMRASDGKIIAGAGAVTLDVNGATFLSGTATANKLKFVTTHPETTAEFYSSAGSGMVIDSFGVTQLPTVNPHTQIFMRAYHATGVGTYDKHIVFSLANLSAGMWAYVTASGGTFSGLTIGDTALASSVLQVNGPIATKYVTKSGNYTVTASDSKIVVTAACTMTLPTAASITGREYHIKATVDNVVVDGNGSETIDGDTTVTLLADDGLSIYSDGTNWRIF